MKILLMLSACVLMVNACGKGGDHSVDDKGYHYTNGDEIHSLYPRIRGDKYGATYTYERGDLEVYGGGSVNSKRDWEAEVGIEYRFRRSAHSPRFNVTLHVDPCSFLAYDLNRNGEFSKDELSAIFGKDEKANALFAGLDMDPNDGVITEEEFLAMGPLIIADCFNNEK